MLTALDIKGNDVFIEDAVVGQDYYCPCCGGIVKCRARNSDKVREHFYHTDKTNCDGGESSLHKYWKYHLFNVGDVIDLPLVGKIKCLNRWIEYPTKDNKYKPDLIIKTDNPKHRFIVFEILNTNRKDIKTYKTIWSEYKYPVFEVDIKPLNQDKSNIIKCLRLLYHPEKQAFVAKTKFEIRDLYDVLEKESGCLDYYDEYMLLKKSIGKVYRILKTELNIPIRVNLSFILRDLDSKFWDNYNVWRNFVLPLKKIVQQISIYQ